MAGHYRVGVPCAQIRPARCQARRHCRSWRHLAAASSWGVTQTVDMCVSGGPIKTEQELELGLSTASSSADCGLAPSLSRVRLRESHYKIPVSAAKPGRPQRNDKIFAAARAATRKRQRGMMAPLAAIDAIEAAVALSALRAVDFDIIFLNGFSVPAYRAVLRGLPMLSGSRRFTIASVGVIIST